MTTSLAGLPLQRESLPTTRSRDNPPGISYRNRNYTLIKYSTLTAIALASFLIGPLSLPLTLLGSSFALKHVVRIIETSDRNQPNIEKVHRIFQIIIWTTLTISAVGFGLTALNLVQSISGLYHSFVVAPNLFQSFLSCHSLAFTLGFMYPFSRGFHLIANRMDHYARNNLNNRGLPISLLEIFTISLGSYPLENIIPILPFVDISIIRSSFEHSASRLSDTQIETLQTSRPDLFTYEYLARHLSDEQLQRLTNRQWGSDLQSFDCMIVQRDLETWFTHLQTLKDRYAQLDDTASNKAVRPLYDEMQAILPELARHVQNVSRIKQIATTLPDDLQIIRHEGLRSSMQIIKDLSESSLFKEIYSELTSNDTGSLRNQLIAFSSLLTAKIQLEEEENLAEEAYMVLATRSGFRLIDFKNLANRLGLLPDNNAIQTVSQKLAEQGLSNLEDLYRYGIFHKNEICDRDLVIQRLHDFIDGKLISTVQPTDEAHEQQAPLQNIRPPIQTEAAAASSSIQLKLYRLANSIYHYTLTISFIGIQWMRSPLALPLGFAYGIVAQRYHHRNFLTILSHWLTFVRNWQVSSDYLHMSASVRARNFYARSLFTVLTTLGPFSAFIGGMNHASHFLLAIRR